MAFPLLPLLLLGGLGAGAAILIAAKNPKGEDVKLGKRSIIVRLFGKGEDRESRFQLYVTPQMSEEGHDPKHPWMWEVKENPSLEGWQYLSGNKTTNRVQALTQGLSYLLQLPDKDLWFDYKTMIVDPPTQIVLQLDFIDSSVKPPPLEEIGEHLIFRASIIPTAGGWLTQITDPSATVKFLKTFSSRSKAISEAYKFVEKAGY